MLILREQNFPIQMAPNWQLANFLATNYKPILHIMRILFYRANWMASKQELDSCRCGTIMNYIRVYKFSHTDTGYKKSRIQGTAACCSIDHWGQRKNSSNGNSFSGPNLLSNLIGGSVELVIEIEIKRTDEME